MKSDLTAKLNQLRQAKRKKETLLATQSQEEAMNTRQKALEQIGKMKISGAKAESSQYISPMKERPQGL